MFFRKNRQSNPGTLKKRLFAAAAMLLVASVLMGTTSYAWLVMSVAPEITGMSMEEIGREFGGRDHSTIVYSMKVMNRDIQTDTRLRETVDDIIKNVRS